MTEKTIYISDDGQKFETKDECVKHELMLKDIFTTGVSYMKLIKSYCESRDDHLCIGDDSFGKCPFYDDALDECLFCGQPNDWMFKQ